MDKVSDGGRRKAMRNLLGMAVAVLDAGCCSTSYPAGQLNRAARADAALPLLRPARMDVLARGYPCIDVHAHLFNASDINVRDFLGLCLAHMIRSPLLRAFVEALAPVLAELAELAPSAQDEYAYLLAEQGSANVRTAATARLAQAASAQRERIAVALAAAMRARGLDRRYEDLQAGHAALMRTQFGAGLVQGARPAFSVDTVRTAIDPALRRRAYGQAYGSLLPAASGVDPGGVLEVAGHLLSYRWMNLRDYTLAYTDGEGAFGINAVFSALVDFDYWLGCFPASARIDQMKLHALLSQLSGGYMLPIVSYNPWTDIVQDDASLRLLQLAVEHYGYVGVKIYPPMGYFPAGNAGQFTTASGQPRPDLVQLDRKLAAMFDWCAARGVPVMAHCAESNGRDDASDEFALPAAWDALLRRYAGRLAPTINAGHFGGALPKPGAPANAWPQQFGAIIGQPEGASLYGDLAYWSELRVCGAGQADCETALARLSLALGQSPRVAGHLMYGSDWLMLSMEPDWGAYPAQLAANLAGLPLSARALFSANALQCFGLAPGGAQRERILASLGGALPAWLS